jgi:hypothetical protein
MSGLTTAEEKPQNYKPHLYKVRGFARVSKSGKALNLSIKEGEVVHLLTISKADIIDSFNHGTQCCIIEYELSVKEKQELKKNGS